MNFRKTTLSIAFFALLLTFSMCMGNTPAKSDMIVKPKKPLIQMAILLDNSGSMSGLINQARTQIWDIVNQLALAQKDGQSPELQIALYIYGNSNAPIDNLKLLELTTDLDTVSAKLFGITISGGSEYCGMIIKAAVEQLEWSESPEDYKVIFIAGNEPFTQGNVDYKEACKLAVSKGITVNTIHCGSASDGIGGKWKDGALLADGQYICIDQNQATVQINTPFDKKILDLNNDLNKTYVYYGSTGGRYGGGGKGYAANQMAQDLNAAKTSPSVAVQRAVSKSNDLYINDSWDLVDAAKKKDFDLKTVKKEDLPENMKEMSVEERKEYVQKQAEKRKEIQKEINDLNAKRQEYIKENIAKTDPKTADLQKAVRQAVKDQALKNNFKFKEPTPKK